MFLKKNKKYNMNTFIKFTAYIFILLGFCGCNSGIFIDDFEPSVSELTLDGNGDEAVIRFSGSDWNILDIPVFEQNNIKVYDAAGNLINGQLYLDRLGKIVYNGTMVSFTIEGINSKEVKVAVDENVQVYPFQFLLIASNEYESREIHITISPSDRYVFDRITYSLNAYSYDEPVIEKANMRFDNSLASTEAIYHFFPYKNEYHNVMFKSDDPEAFRLLANSDLLIDIPTIEKGEMGMNGKKAQYVSQLQKLPLPFSDEEKKDVVVKPHTVSHIIGKVQYEWFETKYTLYATHPKTGKKRTITGMMQSSIPKNYNIKREDTKD